MWASIKNRLSVVADILQVIGFAGFTPAAVLALGPAVLRLFQFVPSSYIALWSVAIFLAATYVFVALVPKIGTLSLADAARITYERLRGTLWADAAERMRSERTPEGILDYLATGLSLHVAIYGTYGPSTKLERLPESDVRMGHIERGATELALRDNRNLVVGNLRVRKSDLWTAINHMRQSTAEFNRTQSS